jgi:hypothetical protein
LNTLKESLRNVTVVDVVGFLNGHQVKETDREHAGSRGICDTDSGRVLLVSTCHTTHTKFARELESIDMLENNNARSRVTRVKDVCNSETFLESFRAVKADMFQTETRRPLTVFRGFHGLCIGEWDFDATLKNGLLDLEDPANVSRAEVFDGPSPRWDCVALKGSVHAEFDFGSARGGSRRRVFGRNTPVGRSFIAASSNWASVSKIGRGIEKGGCRG